MKKTTFVFTCCLFITSHILAQSQLRGTILDVMNMPVANAEVRFGEKAVVRTTANGQFALQLWQDNVQKILDNPSQELTVSVGNKRQRIVNTDVNRKAKFVTLYLAGDKIDIITKDKSPNPAPDTTKASTKPVETPTEKDKKDRASGEENLKNKKPEERKDTPPALDDSPTVVASGDSALDTNVDLAILVEPKAAKKFAAEPPAEQEKFLVKQISTIQDQNAILRRQIDVLEQQLLNDKTLSPEEKLNLAEQIKALKRQLYRNDLALRELEDRLQELKRSFWERYRNAVFISGVIIVSLLLVSYLLLLLARYRRQQRDALAEKNEEIRQQSEEIAAQRDEINRRNQENEQLLLNILPADTARELKLTGQVAPRHYESVTVLFTDFQGFSSITKDLPPQEVISKLDYYFTKFEQISQTFELEKIKTIGDAYMAVAGLPHPRPTHAIDAVCAALQMQQFIVQTVAEKTANSEVPWHIRLGLHSGELVAGVIGRTKFAYDIWGNTVNLAARMESSSTSNKIQITEYTYHLIKDYIDCEYRGKVTAKNIAEFDTYYALHLKKEYSDDGYTPNDKFWQMRQALLSTAKS